VFLDYVANDAWFALWRLAATTGRGELLALRWDDVDLAAGRVTVGRSLVLGPDHRVRYTIPKSARRRRAIEIDDATVAALKAHRKGQAAAKLRSLGTWPEKGDDARLVFTDEIGRAVFPRSVTTRFADLVAEAELPHIRLHDLRHTHATLLLREGVPVDVVSERLGHASPSITLDVYAHALADQRTDAATRFAAVIDG
jgi:integrase